MRLKDQVAIVTGGGVGIGKAYCLGLAKEGAKVVAADINIEGAKAVGREIEEKGGESLPLGTNVADLESTLNMAQRTVGQFGKIDILVNNAVLFTALGAGKPWDQLDVEEWDRVMAVNLKGVWLCSQAVVPHMNVQGRGKIINISSGTAYKGSIGRLHYLTSKAGVLGLTRGLARELAGQKINVNSIAVGATLSEGVIARGTTSTPERVAKRISLRCVQKSMYPKDLVGTVIFLSSDESEFVSGQTIVVDGGTVFI